jgi:hypothetical protein
MTKTDYPSNPWIKYDVTTARPHAKKIIYIPISIIIQPGIHPRAALSAKVIGRGVLIRSGSDVGIAGNR